MVLFHQLHIRSTKQKQTIQIGRVEQASQRNIGGHHQCLCFTLHQGVFYPNFGVTKVFLNLCNFLISGGFYEPLVSNVAQQMNEN